MDGDEIRRLREARGLTQEQLAKAIGVGARSVGNWERGVTIPKNSLGRIRDFFGLDNGDDPLRGASELALLQELLRRAIARSGREVG